MYFNHEKENTNIDNQFKKSRKKKGKSNNNKLYFIIGGVVLVVLLLIIIFFIFRNKSKYTIELSGDEIIEVYKGLEYTDPGYFAYDKDKNNVTSKVVVSGNVDTSVIGEYKITYKIDTVTKIRYVNVVERPDSITDLMLLGGLSIDVKVGNTYTDPGYVANDIIDGDLTSKVTISGSVDTSKVGTYKLVYTVVNSSGVITTKERTVNVIK